MRRVVVLLVLVLALLVGLLLAGGGPAAGWTGAGVRVHRLVETPGADVAPPLPGSGARAAGAVLYELPLPGAAVLRPFQPPPTPYRAGHRGVDLRGASGATVLAAADGTVRFAGAVAGRGVLVLIHADGIATEYEPVRSLVAVGAFVHRGQPIAVVAGRHAGCAQGCLHWGARRGEVYLDPMALLRPLGPVVLLPWPRDG